MITPNIGAKADPSKRPVVFTHRKLAILESYPASLDHPDVAPSSVIFGSHNFTIGASTTMDEMSFQIQGESFVQKIRALHENNVADFTHSIDKEELKSHHENSRILRLGWSLFNWIY